MNFIFYIILIILLFIPIRIFSKENFIIKGTTLDFLSTDHFEYNELEDLIYARGSVKSITQNSFLSSNILLYNKKSDCLWAEGDVVFQDKTDKMILGDTMIMKNSLNQGVISNFVLYFSNNTLIVSKLAFRTRKDFFILKDSILTPCKIFCKKRPIWQISSQSSEIDLEHNFIKHRNLFFEVFGVPILYTPYFLHPTSNAKAKSGFLMPELQNKALGIPFYYRILPNLDLTITPRIFKKSYIYEIESRFKHSKNDSMIIQASYGKNPYNKIRKNKNAYYFLADINFRKFSTQYGARIEHASEQAYLKNYYRYYSSSLPSKVYFYNIGKRNYFSLEAIYLEGLNIDDTRNKNPLIYPKVKSKNIVNLDFEGNNRFIFASTSLVYKEKTGKELGRTSLQFDLDKKILTRNGHFFNTILRNRTDIYFISNTYIERKNDKPFLLRTIPELQSIWRYPMIGKLGSGVIIVEPMISSTFAAKKHVGKKFNFIDFHKYELSENNFLLSNHYSGVDSHEFGNRFNYGIKSIYHLKDNYFSFFIGQTYNTNYFDKIIASQENIGKISNNFLSTLEIFYRFRKDRNFKPIRDELGFKFFVKQLHLSFSLIEISNIKKYYFLKNSVDNRVRQASQNVVYHFNESWSLDYSVRLNLPKSKLSILSQSIKITYDKDCIKLSTQLFDDYMVDKKRGIKKTSVPTVVISLKMFNM